MESGARKRPLIEPSSIKNKLKRSEVFNKQKKIKKKEKKKEREKRQKEAEALGEAAPPKQVPRTIDNTREADETVVTPDDEEILEDEKLDEFADLFDGRKPHIMITTSVNPTAACLAFVDELITVIPNSHYYKRGTFNLKDIVKFANNKEFTDLIVINDNRKNPNGMLITHLPKGPTAHFKLSSVILSKDIQNHGKLTSHKPELILNNFNTRLGHTVGRMFAALMPPTPDFQARSCATFHNQRDFIFFRHHRYIFDTKEKVRLQELGPRFCLKLRSLQNGTFDASTGEYEWVHKTEMDTSRKRFFL